MKKVLLLINILLFLYPPTVLAGRGCCSYHGGQDYCGDEGYWICEDGSRSKTCRCNSYKLEDESDDEDFETYDKEDYYEYSYENDNNERSSHFYENLLLCGICGAIGYVIAKQNK